MVHEFRRSCRHRRSAIVIGCGRAGGNIVRDIQRLGALNGLRLNVHWIHAIAGHGHDNGLNVQDKVSVVTMTYHRRHLLKQLLTYKDIAILVVGMGGSAGAHIFAVIAEVVRDAGVQTIGVLTMPFGFEGIRVQRANAAIRRLNSRTGFLLRFSNQQLAMEMGADALLSTVYEVQSKRVARVLRGLLRHWHFD